MRAIFYMHQTSDESADVKSRLLSFNRPVQTNIYNIFEPKRFDISNSPEIRSPSF